MAETSVMQAGLVRPSASPDVYVGPRPFQLGERLYCRDRETTELVSLLISQRLVLFHSPSGAGKTSRVQANLIPKMQKRRFEVPLYQTPDHAQPQPVILRVNREPEPADPAEANRYLLSVLLALEMHRPEDQRRGVAELAGLSLDQYLEAAFPAASRAATDAAAEGGAFRPLLLVFDQFEELLTLDPTDAAAKAEFMRQVGEALQNQGRWALFGIREDFLGALEPYLPAIPTRLTATYRLDLLRAETAAQAIEVPARLAGVTYEDGLIERLISDLRQVKVQRPDGTLEPKAGPYVEPVQLQVVCQSLWRIKYDAAVITAAHLDQLSCGRGQGVDDVLAAYYAQRVEQAAAEGGVAERTIRDWFGKQLISAQGVRRPVLVSEALAAGLTPACLQVLDKAFLIRRDNRSGAQWYELSHDRLVVPVVNDNAAWRTEHLNTFQRQAALWEDSNRRPDLLVTGAILTEGENWAESRGVILTPLERDFLDECRKRHDRRMLFIAGMLALAVATVLATFFGFQAREGEREAVKQTERANRATREADRQRARAESQLYASQINLAQGYWIDGPVSVAWQNLDACQWNLRGWEHAYLFTLFNKNQCTFFAHSGPVHSVAFSPDGKRVVSGSEDRTAKLWDSTTGQNTLTLRGHNSGVQSVAFSPDGAQIVSGGKEPSLKVWDATTGQEILTLTGFGGGVSSVAFSRDGKRILSGSDDAMLKLWDATSGKEIVSLKGHTGAVRTVAFSPDGPDGKRIVSGSDDQTLKVWLLDRWLEKASNKDRADAAKSTHE